MSLRMKISDHKCELHSAVSSRCGWRLLKCCSALFSGARCSLFLLLGGFLGLLQAPAAKQCVDVSCRLDYSCRPSCCCACRRHGCYWLLLRLLHRCCFHGLRLSLLLLPCTTLDVFGLLLRDALLSQFCTCVLQQLHDAALVH